MIAKQPLAARLFTEADEIITHLLGRVRWIMFAHHGNQSVLGHQWHLATIAYSLLSRESRLRGKRFLSPSQALQVIVWALIHDVGEALIPDVPHPVKKDPRLRQAIVTTEVAIGQGLLKSLFPLDSALVDAYVKLHDGSRKSGSEKYQFFTALEELEYYLYALNQYFIHGREDFILVLDRSHNVMMRWLKRYHSFRELINPQVVALVEGALAQNQKLVEGLRIEHTVPSEGLVAKTLLQLFNACREAGVQPPVELDRAWGRKTRRK